MTIGRDKKCTLSVDDEYASPLHCTIKEWDDGVYTVEDNGSTNGTWIQGVLKPLLRVYAPTVLEIGDEIRVGRTWIPWREQ